MGGAPQAAHLHPELCVTAHLSGAVQQPAGAALPPSHAEVDRLLRHFLS